MSKKRIVVVDDLRDFLDLVETILTAEGYEVTTCEQGLEAHKLIKNIQPDLAILDIMLPDESGWAVLNLVKLDPATRHIPMIICSAAVQPVRNAEEMLREKNCFVLLKPFDLDELTAKVKQALDSSPM